MPREGDIVSQYRLIRKIGEGGMGVVYEAVHARIRSKRAAIKVLHADSLNDPDAIARFEREAEAAAAIGHEGIVDVYDLGVSGDGSPYMVMEYLEGETLKELMARVLDSRPGATFATDLTVYLGCNVLSALSAAHRSGIVHRDLKPENVFLVETGSDFPRVKLLDFGIARITDLGGRLSDTGLTKTGTVMGTPYFMSPEQAMGEKELIDQRTDLWSLGVILYACTTGRYPYEGEYYNQLVSRLVSTFEPPRPGAINPDIPSPLEAVILRAMAKDLEQRYSSAKSMLEDLLPLSSGATQSFLALSERKVSSSQGAFVVPTTVRDARVHNTGGETVARVLESTTTPAIITERRQQEQKRTSWMLAGLVGLALFVVTFFVAVVVVFVSANMGSNPHSVPAVQPPTPSTQPPPLPSGNPLPTTVAAPAETAPVAEPSRSTQALAPFKEPVTENLNASGRASLNQNLPEELPSKARPAEPVRSEIQPVPTLPAKADEPPDDVPRERPAASPAVRVEPVLRTPPARPPRPIERAPQPRVFPRSSETKL